MPILVSILIPCYNAEAWVDKAIKSALAQTWKNIEIIVVDDGSADNSLQIVKQFESPHVKIISQTNQGASTARNNAYAECQGDFIQYLDADDLLAPDKIERQVKLLQQEGLNFIASGAWARFFDLPTEASFNPQPLWRDMEPVDWLVCAWEGHWMMHPAAWLVPRSVTEQAGPWDENLSLNDDGEYFTRIVLASQGIKFCTEARSYYRSGNNTSLSASKSEKTWNSALNALLSNTKNLLERENTPRTRRVCAMAIQRLIYEIYPDASEIRAQAEAKVLELGGSKLRATGGPFFNGLAAMTGWKTAKHAQRLLYRYGYRKVALGKKLVSGRSLAN